MITTREDLLVPTEIEEMLIEQDGILDAGIVELPG